MLSSSRSNAPIVDARWASPPALSAASAVAAASFVWQWLGERHSAGDLRPSLFVQFLPMLLVPITL